MSSIANKKKGVLKRLFGKKWVVPALIIVAAAYIGSMRLDNTYFWDDEAKVAIVATNFYGLEIPLLYGPLNSNAFSFYKPLSCSPCITAYNHRNSPCDGDNICLKRISPEEVLVKAYEMFESQKYNK